MIVHFWCIHTKSEAYILLALLRQGLHIYSHLCIDFLYIRALASLLV